VTRIPLCEPGSAFAPCGALAACESDRHRRPGLYHLSGRGQLAAGGIHAIGDDRIAIFIGGVHEASRRREPDEAWTP
jgi:hypothetical protein